MNNRTKGILLIVIPVILSILIDWWVEGWKELLFNLGIITCSIIIAAILFLYVGYIIQLLFGSEIWGKKK